MKEVKNNSRRDFLKKISVAAVTMGAFSYLGFNKSGKHPRIHVNSLSKEQADEIIREEKFPSSMRIKPAAPPKKGEIKKDQ